MYNLDIYDWETSGDFPAENKSFWNKDIKSNEIDISKIIALGLEEQKIDGIDFSKKDYDFNVNLIYASLRYGLSKKIAAEIGAK